MVNANPKSIELYVLVDGNEVPFYGRSYAEFVLSNGDTFVTKDGFVFNVVHSNEQVKVGSFRYDAKRMGGAPIITFTLMYDECLDKLWSDQVYAKFRGERYFLKQTPTSSKSNDDARYKHDVELIAERTILDNAYFYDAVVGSPIENDVPVTNSTKFHFYGHIEKFVERMNASLQYTGIQKVDEDGNVVSGYHVVLDDDVVTRDQKQVSFDSAVFSQALQESYNTFGIPFYFDGQTIHIGFTNNVIGDVLEYGVDGALLSATKTNANFKVINRATGNGSSDNIPYYYPNNAPKGEIECTLSTSSEDFAVQIENYELFSERVKIYTPLVCVGGSGEFLGFSNRVGAPIQSHIYESFTINKTRTFTSYIELKSTSIGKVKILLTSHQDGQQDITSTIRWVINDAEGNEIIFENGDVYEFTFDEVGKTYKIPVKLTIYPKHQTYTKRWISYLQSISIIKENVWEYQSDYVNLEDVGLSYVGMPNAGDTITQRLVKKVNTSSTLQPSIYRATYGKERFYNAVNYPFAYVDGYELKYGEYVLDGEVHNDVYKKDDGTYYEFTNEYKEGRPREHVFTVDDIKPTIKEATNNISWVETDEEGNDKTVFQRIDMFSEFAYNIGDNDETYTDPNGDTSFKHPYFFAKLRKLDFNLFEHASELGEMTFSMTSGHCGACNFKIGVSEDYPQYNTVQVDEEGNLVYDENGYVLCGLEDFQGKVEPQDRQQDTVNYEVWIALKKEEDTYGILMPKAPKYEGETLVDAGHRPVACSSENANDGDTFVILNINLPDEYIYRAEKKLEKAIVKYIWENNVEKFNFSVNFSRIFLEENYLLKGDESVLSLLNENARLTRVKYNGDEYILYVSSYSYSMNDGDVLPEIRVELDDTLTISQNALQNAIDGVKSDIASAINAIDVAAIGSRYFLRKDTYDVAEAPIEFKKGVVFGDNGMVEVNEDGTSKLTIDYLDVTRKATFTSLEIQEKSHVGGEILITPASMVCNKVEELEDAYRCYFETYGESGEEIFNQFAEGDQAISQTFNEWGGHYYWRLVTGIGEDYIDLSKTDCTPESDVPKVGDKIIQLGNRTNTTRQAAQVLSSHGENAPSFIMYNGIDSFSLVGKEVTGIEWNAEKQEPQMYSYGSFYFGDRNLEDNFITFQKKEGEEKKSLHINANVTIGADSSGLTNLSEWKDKQAQIDKAQADASVAQQTANVANASVSTLNTRIDAFDETIEEINNKLDGVVESYFDDYTPSRTNEPAATWITDGTEADHVGDTFTNTALQGEDAGKSWRWLEQSDGTYDWQQIADSDAAKALALAGQAKATADGKTTTFLVTPSNYSVGDIWIVGDVVPEGLVFKRGDILTTSNSSVEYVANHWSKYLNYMDEFETELNETVGELENSISEAEDAAKQYSDEGKEVLQGLINDLEKSKAEVNDVYTKAQSDGIISQSEQQAINASKAYADAQKELLDTTLKAYADGVADNAEKEAIADAQAKVESAKKDMSAYTDTKISEVVDSMNQTVNELENSIVAAEKAAKDYSDEGQLALQKAIDAMDDAKANITEVYTRTQADGKVSEAEQRAINAADAYAKEAQRLAEETAKAYTDDEVDEAEKAAIAEAEAKVNAAKKELNDAIDEVDGKVEGAIQELENKANVSDIEYLTTTFDKTVDVNGVVMTEMVAVKNESEKVEALINGNSDFANSLMIAAGIPEKVTVNNKDNVDLKERAKKAKFRVYDNGQLHATEAYISGQITAKDGGKIGPMNIYDYGLSMLDWPSEMKVGDTFPAVTLGVNTFEYATMRAVGSSYAEGVKMVKINNSDTITSPSIFAYKNNEYCNPDYAAIEAECEGGYAFRARAGQFAGLRPKIRTITDSDTLSQIDHSIIDICPYSHTITLPEEPRIGQVYEIYMAYMENASHRVTIWGRGIGIQDAINNSWGNTSMEVKPYGIVRLVCANDQNGVKLWWLYRLA